MRFIVTRVGISVGIGVGIGLFLLLTGTAFSDMHNTDTRVQWWALIIYIVGLALIGLMTLKIVQANVWALALFLLYISSLMFAYGNFGMEQSVLPHAVVHLKTGGTRDGILLNHADGHWYVIDANGSTAQVQAFQDNTVMVTIPRVPATPTARHTQ